MGFAHDYLLLGNSHRVCRDASCDVAYTTPIRSRDGYDQRFAFDGGYLHLNVKDAVIHAYTSRVAHPSIASVGKATCHFSYPFVASLVSLTVSPSFSQRRTKAQACHGAQSSTLGARGRAFRLMPWLTRYSSADRRCTVRQRTDFPHRRKHNIGTICCAFRHSPHPRTECQRS